MFPQRHVKHPGHSDKNAGGRIQFNNHTSLTRQSQSGLTMLSRHNVGTYQGNEFTRNTSGKAHPESSQLLEPLWTDPGPKSGICARADLHLGKEEEEEEEDRKKERKKERKSLAGNYSSDLPP